MVIDDVRMRLRRNLQDSFGAEEASYLMDRPPGGWNELVTVPVLEARLSSLGDELRSELQRELRAQTWRLATLVIAAQTVVVAALGGIGAVLRFA
jgi:hypothetical protein